MGIEPTILQLRAECFTSQLRPQYSHRDLHPGLWDENPELIASVAPKIIITDTYINVSPIGDNNTPTGSCTRTRAMRTRTPYY